VHGGNVENLFNLYILAKIGEKTMIYFTADTHFCHKNVIESCNRPFDNIEQMNQTLIDNWNSRVKAEDEIYILGDFFWRGKISEANEILEKLKGRKYMLRGNHDFFLDDKDFNKTHFEWIKDYHVLKYQWKKIILFHYPIWEWEGYLRGSIHLHGHVHDNAGIYHRGTEALGKQAINVGVDVHGYYPISIEEVLETVNIASAP
jgi:calcineurin-like phosphoesterase family protein